jgi:hypothetical protein
MTKTSGLGDNCYLGGYDLSGDIMSLSKIGGGMSPLDVTPINVSAHVRIGGLRDGGIDFNSAFDTVAGQEHPVLSVLPTADVQVRYMRGTASGNAAAVTVAKQVDYNPTRDNAGMLTVGVSTLSNGFGLQFGDQLTPGLRTDTTATNGTSFNGLASSAFGAEAFLQVTAFTGTDVTVTIQDSADNSSFTNVTGLSFVATTAAHTTQRIFTTNVATIRQYVRAVTTTSAGFTTVTFAVVMVRNPIAGQVF